MLHSPAVNISRAHAEPVIATLLIAFKFDWKMMKKSGISVNKGKDKIEVIMGLSAGNKGTRISDRGHNPVCVHSQPYVCEVNYTSQ